MAGCIERRGHGNGYGTNTDRCYCAAYDVIYYDPVYLYLVKANEHVPVIEVTLPHM